VRFHERLRRAWSTTGSLLCVGLDPDPSRFPEGLTRDRAGLARFCRTIVDATGAAACAFKPQIAYFAAMGAERELEALCAHVRSSFPDAVLVLDAKRGDIGDTARMYAAEAFDRYGADAVTVSPYLGTDSLEPFLAWPDRGVFVLCRTSNPGAAEFQSLESGGVPLYLAVARTAAASWRLRADVGLVVGATAPEELRAVRAVVGDMPLLVPGIGAQGGDLVAAVRAGRTPDGTGLLVNSSRAILYADPGAGWADAAGRTAIATRDAIRAATAG
jgi:orotidine-5'-phosphate decarboxylase